MTIEPLTPFSPYTRLTRAEWARLRADAALTLTPEDVLRLQGLNERVAMEEVVAVYLPLARLLRLYVEAEHVLYRARAMFLGDTTAKVPYVIGLAGTVGVGKSTTARILRELLARWPEHPFVSDFFDFSIYVDAPEADIRRWYVERFLLLRATAFQGDGVVFPALREP